MASLGERIKALEQTVKEADAKLQSLLLELPNLPDPSVPAGTTEEENVEVRRWGTPRRFDFEPKPHEDVGEKLGLLDIERATKIAKEKLSFRAGREILARFFATL